MSDFALSEVQRLLANLVRVGTVTALDTANARVKVDAGGLSTDWLPWLTARAGATRTWSAPRPGEQVLVLSPYGDTSQGVVLPAIYQDTYPAPAASQDLERVAFPDGTTVTHDSGSNTLQVDVAGAAKVIVNCKQATVTADTSVTLNAPQTTVTGALLVKGPLTFQAGMQGSGGSGGATMQIDGSVAFANGALTHNGKNVGSTHTHTGVTAGPGTTGPVS